ncbi:MAG: phosphotransferase enzyme family protein [Pseudonocardia sp.]
MSAGARPSFESSLTRATLGAACRRAGLDPAGAELLRLGENALYRLSAEPVVVRIARSMEHWTAAAKEVAVAAWLAKAGVEAARTWDVDQPIEVDGYPVTFWRLIDGRNGGPDDVAQLGQVLRRLHELTVPSSCESPAADMLGRVEPRIRRAGIPEPDQDFLAAVLGEQRQEIKGLEFELAPAVIHGDAHVQNLMFVGEQPVLIDFERVAFGQPEWDLAVTATEYVTAGWWTDEQYATFVESYGYDVMAWSGFDTLRRVNEIKMTTWLMQNIGESPDIEREYQVRMQTIRGERNDRAWRTF